MTQKSIRTIPGRPVRERCVCLLPRDDFQAEILITEPQKRHILPDSKNKINKQGRCWNRVWEGVRGLLDEQWVERKLLRAVGRIPGPAVEWWRPQELGDRTSEGKGAKQYPPAFLSLAFQLITKNPPSVTLEGGMCEQMERLVGCLYLYSNLQ